MGIIRKAFWFGVTLLLGCSESGKKGDSDLPESLLHIAIILLVCLIIFQKRALFFKGLIEFPKFIKSLIKNAKSHTPLPPNQNMHFEKDIDIRKLPQVQELISSFENRILELEKRIKNEVAAKEIEDTTTAKILLVVEKKVKEEISKQSQINHEAITQVQAHELFNLMKSAIAQYVKTLVEDNLKTSKEAFANYTVEKYKPIISQEISKLVSVALNTKVETSMPEPKVEKNIHSSLKNVINSKAESNIQQVTAIFAAAPQGNLFHKLSDQFHPFESLYIILPNPINREVAAYSLVKDSATLEHAFSMVDSLRDACDLLGKNNPTAKTMIIRKEGRVEKQGDYWMIVEKLHLDW